MGDLRLSNEEMHYIALFESLTGTVAKDCIVDPSENKLVFVVKEGMAGMAIGRGGSTVERVRKATGMSVEIVEFSENEEEFLRNLFQQIEIKRVKPVSKDGRRIIYVEVPQKDKGLAIGKGGRNIQKVKNLMRRHHDVDDVIIM